MVKLVGRKADGQCIGVLKMKPFCPATIWIFALISGLSGCEDVQLSRERSDRTSEVRSVAEDDVAYEVVELIVAREGGAAVLGHTTLQVPAGAVDVDVKIRMRRSLPPAEASTDTLNIGDPVGDVVQVSIVDASNNVLIANQQILAPLKVHQEITTEKNPSELSAVIFDHGATDTASAQTVIAANELEMEELALLGTSWRVTFPVEAAHSTLWISAPETNAVGGSGSSTGTVTGGTTTSGATTSTSNGSTAGDTTSGGGTGGGESISGSLTWTNTFGTQGRFNITAMIPTAMFVEEFGSIVVAGYTSTNTAMIQRYSSGGIFSASFGTISPLPSGFGEANGQAHAMIRDSDGSIFVAGAAIGSTAYSAIAKLNSSGDLVSAFGVGGIYKGANGDSCVYAVALYGNNQMVAAGISDSTQAALLRLDRTTGAGDNGFGTGGSGVLTFGSIGNTFSSLHDLDVTQDGSIIAGGVYDISMNNEHCVLALKVDQNGVLATDFGTNGIFQYCLGANTRVTGLKILNDGKILMAVDAEAPVGANSLIRLTSAGQLETHSTETDNGFRMAGRR
jgi:hypothetical protein